MVIDVCNLDTNNNGKSWHYDLVENDFPISSVVVEAFDKYRSKV